MYADLNQMITILVNAYQQVEREYLYTLNFIFSKKNIIVEGGEPRDGDLAAEW